MFSVYISSLQIMLTVVFINFLYYFLRKKQKKDSIFFILIIISDMVMLLTSIFDYILLNKIDSLGKSNLIKLAIQINSCVSYISYYSLISFFIYYVLDCIYIKNNVKWTFGHINLSLCFIYAIGWCISAFNGMFYSYEQGLFSIGKFYWFGQLGGYLSTIIFFIIMFQFGKTLPFSKKIAMTFFILIPFIFSFLRLFNPVISVQLGLSVSVVLIFNYVHLENEQLLIKQQEKIIEDKIALSFSQIQPHFIFNTLNSIYILCDKDSKLVKKSIEDFSSYLRTNLLFSQNVELIPFSDEIENLNHYINLEKIRFQDDLYVAYDFQETAFKIPPLTLQPLVENAIKHGILKQKGGGVISIATCKTDDCYKIKLTDDGVGFDVSILDKINSDNSVQKNHIGIKNVKERLWLMCKGEMEIKSIIGKGTSVFIQIPISTGGRK